MSFGPRFTSSWLLAGAIWLMPMVQPGILAQEPTAATEQASEEQFRELVFSGTLTETSRILEDDTYFNSHQFEGQAGDFVTLELASDEFDTYVLLLDAGGEILAQNDDSDGTNASLKFMLPETGSYTVWANAHEPAALGSYTLTVKIEDSSELNELQEKFIETKEDNNLAAQLIALNDIATFYSRRREYLKQAEYFQKGVEVALKLLAIANEDEIANANTNLAFGYRGISSALLGHSYILQKQGKLIEALELSEKALHVAQTSLAYAKTSGNSYIEASSYISILQSHQRLDGIYYSLAEYNKGLQAAQKTLKILRQIPYSILDSSDSITYQLIKFIEGIALSGVGSHYHKLSEQYLQTEQYEKAIELATHGLAYEYLFFALTESQLESNLSEENKTEWQQAQSTSTLGISTAYSTIAAIYGEQGKQLLVIGEYDQALAAQETRITYIQKDKELIQQQLDSELSADERKRWGKSEQSNLGILITAYSDIADIYEAQKDFLTVLEIHQKRLEIAQQGTNPDSIIVILGSILTANTDLNRYQEALSAGHQILSVAEKHKKPRSIGQAYFYLGSVYDTIGRFPEAVDSYEQALMIAQENGWKSDEQVYLNNLATVFNAQGQYKKALETYNLLLKMVREFKEKLPFMESLDEVNSYCGGLEVIRETLDLDNLTSQRVQQLLEQNRQGCLNITINLESNILNNIAGIYESQGQYQDAIDLYHRSLEIEEPLNDQHSQAVQWGNIGVIYSAQGDYETALEYSQKALSIYEEFKDRSGISLMWLNIGDNLLEQGHYKEAAEYFDNALAMMHELELQPIQTRILRSLGSIALRKGNYKQAISYYEEALVLSRKMGLLIDQAIALNDLGIVAFDQGHYDQAIEYKKQGLTIYEAAGDRPNQATSLLQLGSIYKVKGNYARALELQSQALGINESIGDRDNEAYILQTIGYTYQELGQYDRALELSQRALRIFEEIGARPGMAASLEAIGELYTEQDIFEQAFPRYEQALELWKDIGALASQDTVLQSIGFAYEKQNNYAAAKDAFERALAIQQQIGARGSEGTTLNGLALAEAGLNNPDRALELLKQSLALHRELGNYMGEIRVTGNIGQLLADQDQPELAITFLKKSINLTETIRTQLNGLPNDEQKAFAQSVSSRYRLLTDLLLQQDRVLEAQEVLDLLKLQEIEDYNLESRGNEETAQGLDLWPPEQKILDEFDQYLLQSPEKSLKRFLNSSNIRQQVDQLRRNAQSQNLNPQQLEKLQDNLQNLGNAALLYPLILEDRLELILVTPSSLIRKTVSIDRLTLNQTILSFRDTITNPYSNPISDAQQLYQWLIQPIADDLAQTDTLLYAADGQLRYIPLAALHDGEQWLTQRFTINHITAASLTDFRSGKAQNLNILAGAFSNPDTTYEFTIGEKPFRFSGLPYAGVEVETIARNISDTKTFFDQDFSWANLEPQMADHSIVHFATHAEFVPGAPDDSFVLLGDGDRISLRDIANWNLPNTDLVVLSACKTAVSGELGDGEEILGFGYQIQRTGADAAIASLWPVNDSGTQSLMNVFYEILQQGYSEAEALKLAQNAIITSELPQIYQTLATERAGINIIHSETEGKLSLTNDLTHPYYWAPFILIGNGF